MIHLRLTRMGIVAISALCLLPATMPGYALDLDELKDQFEESSGDVKKHLDNYQEANREITVDEEVEIGENLTASLLGAAPLVKDRKLQRYVNDVGFWIASRTGRPDLPWRFAVIDSQGINAFAAPGGHVMVTLGLYQLLDNEAQLAGVLAHEIAHVIRKHHLEALQKSMKREFWGDLSMQAIDDKSNRKVMRKVISSGLQLYTTGLDREYEFDADLRGVVLMARAGYDPYAFLDVLTTIDSINPGSAELAVLMNTHPPTAARLSILAERMEGVLDSYANGVDNAGRFRQVATEP